MAKCCLSKYKFLNYVLQFYKMYFTKSQDMLDFFVTLVGCDEVAE